LREQLAALKDLDAQLIAIDPHEKWSAKFLLEEAGFETDDVSYPLLMDPSLTVSAAYGVCFQMRIHVELSSRPATFIIDRDGILRYAKRGESFADRPKPGDILRELKKLGGSKR
jgi:peroxiredoxin